MKIDINDSNGYRYTITSSDYELIGRWFTEQVRHLISADARYNHPFYVDIWPGPYNTDADLELLRTSHRTIRNVDELHEFIKQLLEVSGLWESISER